MLAASTVSALRTGHRSWPGGSGRLEPAWLAVPVGFLAASIPFSYLVARRLTGLDLRKVGSGTVSGTGLFEVAGFGPLAAAGILEVAKGAVGPLLAGKRHPVLAAAATGAAVVGHNWSPWLRGAGGRGLSPALGALGVAAPAAAVSLLGGMAGGRVVRQSGVGVLLGDVVAVPIARRAHGREASWAASAAVVPMIAKRLSGNWPPPPPRGSTYAWRLLFDRDTRHPRAPLWTAP